MNFRVLSFPITQHMFGIQILLHCNFTSSNIYSTLLSICHDSLLTVSPVYINKNTNAAGRGGGEPLCFF